MAHCRVCDVRRRSSVSSSVIVQMLSIGTKSTRPMIDQSQGPPQGPPASAASQQMAPWLAEHPVTCAAVRSQAEDAGTCLHVPWTAAGEHSCRVSDALVMQVRRSQLQTLDWMASGFWWGTGSSWQSTASCCRGMLSSTCANRRATAAPACLLPAVTGDRPLEVMAQVAVGRVSQKKRLLRRHAVFWRYSVHQCRAWLFWEHAHSVLCGQVQGREGTCGLVASCRRRLQAPRCRGEEKPFSTSPCCCRLLAVLAVTDPVKEEAAGVVAAIEVKGRALQEATSIPASKCTCHCCCGTARSKTLRT